MLRNKRINNDSLLTPKLCFRHGSVNPHDGNINKISGTERKRGEKTIRYAMLHDETACIGCTACMDACRETNQVPEGVSRLEIIRSEPYGEFPNAEYEFSAILVSIVTMHLVCMFVQQGRLLLTKKQVLSMCTKIFVSVANIVLLSAHIVFDLFTPCINQPINVTSVAIPI